MLFAMKQLWVLSLALIGAILPEEELPPPGLTASIIVFSDPHYFDPSLGTEGPAFEAYLDNDRKLLRESTELLEEAIDIALRSGAGIVLIPGDLTKDGTLLSHRGVARELHRLEAHGPDVLVVPGNHDVSNGEAFAYRGDSAVRVENLDPEGFARLYGPFGYDEAISRDSFSLSYLVEPVESLWILGLDACRYDLNDPRGHSHTGGSFRQETLAWLEQLLTSEEAAGKTIIAMMHHGVLEHYRGQKKYFGEYVVDDHRKVSRMLARLGVRVVFTGHYHANDITMKQFGDGSTMYDIQTGSLVTWPCPVRSVRLEGDSMHIETRHISSIPSHGNGFPEYARSYVISGVSGIAEQTLLEMKLRPEDASRLSSQIGEAFAAHYYGDETPREPPIDLEGVNLKGRTIISFRKKLVRGLYNDLPPADNNLSIHLSPVR